jgi:hypothetical protein
MRGMLFEELGGPLRVDVPEALAAVSTSSPVGATVIDLQR